MKLWLDADAAPQAVKEICLRASERLALTTILVANQRLPLPGGYAHATASALTEADVADRYIESTPGRRWAGRRTFRWRAAVSKGVVVLDPRGDEYTAEVIGERLSVRNFMDALRTSGVETGGHPPYGPRDKQAFANALDRALTRALRRG